ncbi:MAG: amino acid permease [bacterium]|nr:amino acid permease [bacterium]
MTNPPGELKQVLSFRDVLFIAVGQIIGAGVVALTGVAIGMTGPSVILAFLVASALVLVVSVLIMVAGAALPAVGAYYVWSSRLGSGWLGSVVLMLILLASTSLSLYGSSFGLYLNPLFPALSVNAWGIVVIVALFVANLLGLRIASGVQAALVLVLISALAIYAGFAMPRIDASLLTPMFPKGMVGFVSAVFLLKFATGGALLVVGLGGETRNPGRTIPMVIVTSTLLVAVIYAFVALASVGVSPWQEMIDQPLTVAGEKFLPNWAMTYFLVGGAGLAICTTLNAQFIQLPRNFMVASWDNLLPEWIGRMNRHGAPHRILFIMLVVGVVPLIADLDIGVIARAATISATLPGLFIFWVITRIPEKFPAEYERSLLKLNRFWLWAFFIVSEALSIVGVAVLAQGLPLSVVLTLVIGFAAALAYYPMRKRYLARKGIDLDAVTSDRAILSQVHNPAASEPSAS